MADRQAHPSMWLAAAAVAALLAVAWLASARPALAAGPTIDNLASPTHPNPGTWYSNRSATFTWESAPTSLTRATDDIALPELEFVGDVKVVGGRLYIAHATRLTIYDVSDPDAPSLLSDHSIYDIYPELPPYTFTYALDVVGSYAYVGWSSMSDTGIPRWSGLLVYDVSDPTNPTAVGYWNTTPDGRMTQWFNSVRVLGDRLHAAVGVKPSIHDEEADWYVVTLDVSDPTAPTLVGGMGDLPGEVVAMTAAGKYAYAVDKTQVHVIDLTTASPTIVGSSYTFLLYGRDVAADAERSLVHVAGDVPTEFTVVDVSNPAAPAHVGYLHNDLEGRGVALAGHHAYVAFKDDLSIMPSDYLPGGLEIVDVADPAAPTEVARFTLPSDCEGIDVALKGSHAYLLWAGTSSSAFEGNWLTTLHVGAQGYSYRLDQSPSATPDTLADGTAGTATVTAPSDGVWYFHVRGVDGTGTWGPTTTRTVRIDTLAPTTTDNAPSSWQRGPVTFTLTPTDATSGIKTTTYSINGSPWRSGTQVTVGVRRKGCPDGTYTISYRSGDNALNVEAVKTCAVKIDATPPMTFCDAPVSSMGPVTVHLLPFDGRGSGFLGSPAGTWHRVDGSGWTTGNTFVVSGTGTHTIEFYSVDAAGNTESMRATRVTIGSPSARASALRGTRYSR